MIKKNNDSKSSVKILVIDDEIDIIDVFTIFFKQQNYSCTGIVGPEMALQEYQNNSYDIVFVDVWMPGTSGIELVESMKEHKSAAQFIYVTGDISIIPTIREMKRPQDKVFTKPISPFDCLRLVKDIERKMQKQEE